MILLTFAATGSFFTTATYENITDFDVFPFDEEPVWILGVKYSVIHGKCYFSLTFGF